MKDNRWWDKVRGSGGVAGIELPVPSYKGSRVVGRCTPEVFAGGSLVTVLVGGRSWNIEALVRRVRADSRTRTDWHFAGGRAQILTLDDPGKVWVALKKRLPGYKRRMAELHQDGWDQVLVSRGRQ